MHPARRRSVPAEYLPLHKYLDDRFADTVVLTISQIEDILGFPLPAAARRQLEWWTNANTEEAPLPSRSWTQASRSATPNLRSQTVVFERSAG